MALSNHFRGLERGGYKWDAGSILFEFSALREPERTQFPKIGEHLRGLGIEFSEVKPTMLWCGNIVPDLYITNQLDAVPVGWHGNENDVCMEAKRDWFPQVNLREISLLCHGKEFHETFIEPFCQKVTGIPSQEIIARYHRAIWCPLYYPETLREKKSLETRFWYPTAGYAGVIREKMGGDRAAPNGLSERPDLFDKVEITLTLILAKATRPFQSLFVVDKSPVYRVTNQDACAGLDAPYHRFVVESREYCADIADEMQRLNLISGVQYSSSMKIKMPLPTLANYRRGWRPAPNLNEQILKATNGAIA